MQISIVWFIFVKNINKAMNQRMIKFLAWDIDIKRMSTIVHLGDGIVCFPNDTLPIAFCATRTERFVFRQYTGLNDKDGCEIYEGDVVKADGLLPSAIIFYESAFRTEEAAEPLADDAERYGGFTVIGNIYENPELIEA